MSVAQASEASQAQVRAYRARPWVVSGTDGALCTPTTRARKPCLRRAFSHSSPFGDGEQSGGDFEAEYLRSFAIASVTFSSLQATAHPGVIRAASTFALGWAETSIRSCFPPRLELLPEDIVAPCREPALILSCQQKCRGAIQQAATRACEDRPSPSPHNQGPRSVSKGPRARYRSQRSVLSIPGDRGEPKL